MDQNQRSANFPLSFFPKAHLGESGRVSEAMELGDVARHSAGAEGFDAPTMTEIN